MKQQLLDPARTWVLAAALAALLLSAEVGAQPGVQAQMPSAGPVASVNLELAPAGMQAAQADRAPGPRPQVEVTPLRAGNIVVTSLQAQLFAEPLQSGWVMLLAGLGLVGWIVVRR